MVTPLPRPGGHGAPCRKSRGAGNNGARKHVRPFSLLNVARPGRVSAWRSRTGWPPGGGNGGCWRGCRGPRGAWSRPSGNAAGRWPRPARRGSPSARWRPRRGSHRRGCTRSPPARTWTRWMPPWASCGPRADRGRCRRSTYSAAPGPVRTSQARSLTVVMGTQERDSSRARHPACSRYCRWWAERTTMGGARDRCRKMFMPSVENNRTCLRTC